MRTNHKFRHFPPGALNTLLARFSTSHSPPKLGGVPRSGGAVCSKTRSHLMDIREALLFQSVRVASLCKERAARVFEQTAPPSLREGTPPNSGGE